MGSGYILKVCLVLIVAFNMVSLHNKVNEFVQDQKIMRMWIDHHSGYTVQFANINGISQREENKLGQLNRKWITKSKNIILSKNSQEFHPAIDDATPENGNVMIVNDNYFKYNRLYKAKDQLISQKDFKTKYLNVLVPSTRLAQTKSIAKKIRAFLDFQQKMPNSEKTLKSIPQLHYISYIGKQNVFNYTIGKEIKDSISVDPIIIVDDNLLSDDFYLAATSQEMVQFSKLSALQKDIHQLSLQGYITGIIDAKTRLSDFNIKQSRQILLVSLTILISISQLLMIIAFISLAFLEKHQLKMAVVKIFGQSNRQLIFIFWLN